MPRERKNYSLSDRTKALIAEVEALDLSESDRWSVARMKQHVSEGELSPKALRKALHMMKENQLAAHVASE